MVLSKEKKAKLANALARRQRVPKAAGASAPFVAITATPSPTPSVPIVVVPLASAQTNPAPSSLKKGKGVVDIESDEDTEKGPAFKRHRAMVTATSHSSTEGTPASLRDHPPSASSPPGHLALEGDSKNAPATPPAPELPAVLQHALKVFQSAVVEDLDEVISRERLGFNFGTLLAQSNALIITEARVQE